MKIYRVREDKRKRRIDKERDKVKEEKLIEVIRENRKSKRRMATKIRKE